MKYTEVETITPAQRLQLIGLHTLGGKYRRMVEAVEAAAVEITGEDIGGHTGDMMWDDQLGVDEVLRRLGITVVEDADTDTTEGE